jgi:hypothetical protein
LGHGFYEYEGQTFKSRTQNKNSTAAVERERILDERSERNDSLNLESPYLGQELISHLTISDYPEVPTAQAFAGLCPGCEEQIESLLRCKAAHRENLLSSRNDLDSRR